MGATDSFENLRVKVKNLAMLVPTDGTWNTPDAEELDAKLLKPT
jgi:hypothetical protein